MTEWDRPRHPASALLLSRVGAEHGLAQDLSLQGTGLSVEQLADASRTVSAAQELTIVRNLQRHLPHPERVALQAGRRYHLTTHGFWGFAIASSATTADALAVGLRYLSLTWAFSRVFVDEVGEAKRLVVDAAHMPSDVRDFLTLREMASIVTVGLEIGLQPSAIITIGLSIAAPAMADPFVEALLTLPQFEAASNYFQFDPDVLNSALPQADVHTREMAEEHCRELLDQGRLRAGVAGQVRNALAAHPHVMPSIEEIAASLHMSSRTLRRHLDTEGTSFRALADEVRQDLAEKFLTTGLLSVEEIARRLGYSNTPAFSAAFKRWKGVSPRAYAPRRAP